MLCLSNNTYLANSLTVGQRELAVSQRFSVSPLVFLPTFLAGILGHLLLQGSVQGTQPPRCYMCIQAVGSVSLLHWSLLFYLSFHLPKVC